jgi:hypothetical protein
MLLTLAGWINRSQQEVIEYHFVQYSLSVLTEFAGAMSVP